MTLEQIPPLLIIDYDKLRMSCDPTLLTLSTSALCNHPLLAHARRLDCTCLKCKIQRKGAEPFQYACEYVVNIHKLNHLYFTIITQPVRGGHYNQGAIWAPCQNKKQFFYAGSSTPIVLSHKLLNANLDQA